MNHVERVGTLSHGMSAVCAQTTKQALVFYDNNQVKSTSSSCNSIDSIVVDQAESMSAPSTTAPRAK